MLYLQTKRSVLLMSLKVHTLDQYYCIGFHFFLLRHFNILFVAMKYSRYLLCMCGWDKHTVVIKKLSLPLHSFACLGSVLSELGGIRGRGGSCPPAPGPPLSGLWAFLQHGRNILSIRPSQFRLQQTWWRLREIDEPRLILDVLIKCCKLPRVHFDISFDRGNLDNWPHRFLYASLGKQHRKLTTLTKFLISKMHLQCGKLPAV